MKISVRNGHTKIFPQANDIYKLFILIDYLKHNVFDKIMIMKEIKVRSERQVQYYISATEFLGITTPNKCLSEIGEMIYSQDKNIRLQLLCYLILSIDIFADYYLHRNIENIVLNTQKNYGIDSSTVRRRMNSLIKWINWCDIVIKDFSIKIDWLNINTH